MFKLLAEESRMNVRKEYLLRRSVVALVCFLVVILVALVGLFPSYVLSKGRQKEVAERARVLGGAQASQTPESDLSIWLAGLNQKLKLLSPKHDQERATEIIEKALNERGLGIIINNISWTKRDNASAVSIQGVAKDRQSLISFEKRLNASGYFEVVTLPVSNLAKETNISFNLKLAPKKTQ